MLRTTPLLSRCALVAAALGSLLLSPASGGTAQSPDEEAIRAVLTDYVEGWRDADLERLREVFDPAGSVMWRSGAGAEETLGTMDFATVLERRRPQPEYGRQWSVLSLDVLDEGLAVAKLDISHEVGSYVDFLVLYEIAGRWRVVNKTFVMR